MKKFLVISCMLGMMVSLYGCGEEKVDTFKVSDEDISSYVDVSTQITGSIYSNTDFQGLQRVFNKNKDIIESSLFNKQFDTTKTEVQNMYATDETILDTKVSDVFVEKDDEENKVNVIVIHEINSEIDHSKNDNVDNDFNDYSTNHSHKKDKFLISVTDRLTFKDGKLVEFKMYR